MSVSKSVDSRRLHALTREAVRLVLHSINVLAVYLAQVLVDFLYTTVSFFECLVDKRPYLIVRR